MSETKTKSDERFVMLNALELIKKIEQESIDRYQTGKTRVYEEKSGRIQLMRMINDLNKELKKETNEKEKWHQAHKDLTEVYLECYRQLLDEASKHSGRIADLEKAHQVLELVVEKTAPYPFMWQIHTLAEAIVGRKKCKS